MPQATPSKPSILAEPPLLLLLPVEPGPLVGAAAAGVAGLGEVGAALAGRAGEAGVGLAVAAGAGRVVVAAGRPACAQRTVAVTTKVKTSMRIFTFYYRAFRRKPL